MLACHDRWCYSCCRCSTTNQFLQVRQFNGPAIVRALVVVHEDWRLIELLSRIHEDHPIMSFTVSKDSRMALLNIATQVGVNRSLSCWAESVRFRACICGICMISNWFVNTRESLKDTMSIMPLSVDPTKSSLPVVVKVSFVVRTRVFCLISLFEKIRKFICGIDDKNGRSWSSLVILVQLIVFHGIRHYRYSLHQLRTMQLFAFGPHRNIKSNWVSGTRVTVVLI